MSLPLRIANRHGLVAGATGTGKTITVQGLAESFSAVGVPVFVADVKGDLAGIAQPGAASERTTARWKKMGIAQPPFAASAMDGIARQPSAVGDIRGTMIVAAGLIEGAALFALVICILLAFKV